VGSNRSLDAAEQEIIPPAAPNEQERSRAERDSPDSHDFNNKPLYCAKSKRNRPPHDVKKCARKRALAG
jgi:hypothetical protein